MKVQSLWDGSVPRVNTKLRYSLRIPVADCLTMTRRWCSADSIRKTSFSRALGSVSLYARQ